MLMMLGRSARFIAAVQVFWFAAFAEPGPADAHDAVRSSGSIVAFAEPSRADAHDAVQVFWFDCCLRGA